MISEAFVLGHNDFRLPGLGSYMSIAVNQGQFPSHDLCHHSNDRYDCVFGYIFMETRSCLVTKIQNRRNWTTICNVIILHLEFVKKGRIVTVHRGNFHLSYRRYCRKSFI